jgi:hypothetical protein
MYIWEEKLLGKWVGLVMYGDFGEINKTQAHFPRYLIYL